MSPTSDGSELTEDDFNYEPHFVHFKDSIFLHALRNSESFWQYFVYSVLKYPLKNDYLRIKKAVLESWKNPEGSPLYGKTAGQEEKSGAEKLYKRPDLDRHFAEIIVENPDKEGAFFALESFLASKEINAYPVNSSMTDLLPLSCFQLHQKLKS